MNTAEKVYVVVHRLGCMKMLVRRLPSNSAFSYPDAIPYDQIGDSYRKDAVRSLVSGFSIAYTRLYTYMTK